MRTSLFEPPSVLLPFPRMRGALFDAALAATPLPLRPNHITGICNLPPIHQDPFDRALIAASVSACCSDSVSLSD